MSDPTAPSAYAPPGFPGQRLPADHPMRPDLAAPPVQAPNPYDPGPVDEPYAHWWRRVVATLIDAVLVIPFWVGMLIGATIFFGGTTFLTDGTGGVGSVKHIVVTTDTWVGGGIVVAAYLSLAVFSIWNQWVRQGRRGASIGKSCLHLMVVNERSGRPIGVFATIVRAFAHLLDSIPLDLGYLWPLVDRRRQTFADKVVGTVVLHLPPIPAPTPPQFPQQALPSYDS